MADWFALSSRFYTDLDDAGVPEKSQTFLIRGFGYMAANDRLDGFLSRSAAEKLGLRQWRGRVPPLLTSEILIDCRTTRWASRIKPTSDSKYETNPIPEQLRGLDGWFAPRWETWQAPLIAHINKQKADRERAAQNRRKPKYVARQSHDDPAKVATHRTEHNKGVSKGVTHLPRELAKTPPPRTCEQHPDGTGAPCAGCAQARQAHETWAVEAKLAESRARSTDARQRADLRAAAIAACDECDPAGYVGTVLCDHNPDREHIAKRGSAAVRAALTKTDKIGTATV